MSQGSRGRRPEHCEEKMTKTEEHVRLTSLASSAG
jgi:hypothetical protein